MNEIVNKFLLVEEKFMPDVHLNLVLHVVLAVYLLKTKKEMKNLCRQEIQIIFTKLILIKVVFSMVWLMVNNLQINFINQ